MKKAATALNVTTIKLDVRLEKGRMSFKEIVQLFSKFKSIIHTDSIFPYKTTPKARTPQSVFKIYEIFKRSDDAN